MPGSVTVTLSHDLDPALLLLIGKVIVRHGQLEYLLALSIKRTSSMSIQEAVRLTKGMLERSHMASETFALWAQNQEDEAYFDGLLEEARRLNDQRNDIVHAFWTRHDGADHWNRLGVQREINYSELKTLVMDLMSVITRLNAATAPHLVVPIADGIAGRPEVDAVSPPI